jgi:hypothetical protein
MKKKIIFVAICAVLLMIFSSISYGGGNGKYILLAHPEQEFLSPPRGDQFDDVLLVALPCLNNLCLVVCVRKDSPKENIAHQNILRQQAKSETSVVRKEK